MCLLLVNFMLPSTALSEDTPFTIHIVKLVPTYAAYNNVHLFEVDFLKHDLVQYSLRIQYGPSFSTQST